MKDLNDNEILTMLDALIGYDEKLETTEETRYKLAVAEMDECLKIKNLPGVDYILENLYKTNPEYKI